MGCGYGNGEWAKKFGDCCCSDVSCGDCMCEQSTSALKKTHACDWGQNQVEHAECMHCEMLMYASAVARASYIM